MDSITLSFKSTNSIKVFTSKYLKHDFYLTIDSLKGLGDSKRLSTKTLSFFWDSIDNSISGIEAYTNIDRWHNESIIVPNINMTGIIYCTNSFDKNNIAKSLDNLDENWTFDNKLSLLRISFENTKTTQCIQAGKNIIAGVNDSMELAELWIENLRIE